MKNPAPKTDCRCPLAGFGRVVLAGVLCGLTTVIAARAADEPAAESPVTLFVGLDLSVRRGEGYHRMRRFLGNSAEVMIDGQIKVVRVDMADNLRVERGLKFSRAAAVIADLEVTRAYSAGADPRRRWAEAGMAFSGTQSDILDAAVGKFAEAQVIAAGNGASASSDSGVQKAAENLERAISESRSELDDPSFYEGRMQEDLEKELFDVVQAEFTVSSGETLDDCYIVMICDLLRHKDAPEVIRWIYIRSIGELGPEPRQVRVANGGFPPGFILKRHEVHLYSHGNELATNLSEKQVQVPEGDALRFLRLSHQTAHKQETLPPTVAWHDLSSRDAAGMSRAVLRRPVHVAVDAEGEIAGVFTDAACRVSAEPVVERLVRAMRFFPALENGVPVPGRARLTLADYLR